MDVLYPFREVYNNYNDSMWWRDRITQRVLRPIHARQYDSEFQVMKEGWNTLIILDGCREDLFREVVDISEFDSYEIRTSAGSATNEWVERNFDGQALTDTVYVTGNPVVSREVQTAFHAFIEVWRDGFDRELGTVPPDQVTEAAIEAQQEYPDKRLIVHYLQPHYPFIGYPELQYSTFEATGEMAVESANKGASDVWDALGEGLVGYDTVWEAYTENLNVVMKDINKLLESTQGKSVVTADHGNLLGERVSPLGIRLYGHPPYIYHPDLRHVPWAVTGEDSDKSEQQVNPDVEEKLRSLGYVG